MRPPAQRWLGGDPSVFLATKEKSQNAPLADRIQLWSALLLRPLRLLHAAPLLPQAAPLLPGLLLLLFRLKGGANGGKDLA